MKRTLLCIAAILVSMVINAQDAEKGNWAPEVSLKAFVSVYHGSYELSAGARYRDVVFGLGSGYGMEFWDAYPADVKKIPVFGFCRGYVPLGEKQRFLLFGELSVGGECVYNISGAFRESDPVKQTPYWTFRTCFTPGIALRLFGRTNLYLAPTVEIVRPLERFLGATAGLNVSF